MKVFLGRFAAQLPTLYSTEQHGFCANRNCITAIHNIACQLDFTKSHKVPLYMLQCDINKAYDSVDRTVMDQVAAHVGIADNRFYKLCMQSRDQGFTTVVQDGDAGSPFTTSLGIK